MLIIVPYFVFLVQIKIIWDKMHHIINLLRRQASWKNFHLQEKKWKPLKYCSKSNRKKQIKIVFGLKIIYVLTIFLS